MNQAAVQALCARLTTSTQSNLFWVLFQVFRQLGLPQRIPLRCLGQMKNKRKKSFSSTQRRLVSSGIEPRVINLMGYYPGGLPLSYRRRPKQYDTLYSITQPIFSSILPILSMQLIYHVSGRLVIIQAPTISNHNTL